MADVIKLRKGLDINLKGKASMDVTLQVEQNVDKSGSPMFVYQVMIEGIEGCTGKGYSKKESQQLASQDTLKRLRREPQFIDAVFAAKTERTKMEEMPVMNVPDTELGSDIVIIGDDTDKPAVAETAVSTAAADCNPHAATEEPQKGNTANEATPTAPKEKRTGRKNTNTVAAKDENKAETAETNDEFDLSDLTLQPKTLSKEDIINAAEEEAYA